MITPTIKSIGRINRLQKNRCIRRFHRDHPEGVVDRVAVVCGVFMRRVFLGATLFFLVGALWGVVLFVRRLLFGGVAPFGGGFFPEARRD
ncbi:hypothetical protein ACQZV8_09695 [Magnetococcales bacterium HHB-1]